jgi:hypothetical protein
VIDRSGDLHPMTLEKRRSASFAALVCLGLATSVMAQDLTPATTRGTIKVQSRLFNPFDVSQSRLSMDPFGFFTLQQGSKSPSTPAPLLTSSASSSSNAAASGTSTSSDSTASPTGNVATSSAVLDPTAVIAVGAARPPFRPPVRSPFRPPPRPPF